MKTPPESRRVAMVMATVVSLSACASTPTVESPVAMTHSNPQFAVPAHHDESPTQWFEAGARVARERGAGQQEARNLILFVGDGMGPTTVAAARIFAGQTQGQTGEENLLSF